MSGAPSPLTLVVGIEIHVRLRTRTKAFCSCPVAFGAEPNTLCCPVCLGHPGALPALNREAVLQAIAAGLALGCAIAPRGRVLWDRKNYFYPDLPKGYQVTQHEFPLCEAGRVVVDAGRGPRTVAVRRAHLEEDTGRSSHARDGATLLDFNRCGAPLLEVVTEPVVDVTPEEVEAYARAVRDRLRLVGAADADMEKGELRCEPNVSLRRADGASTGISELKNLSSFASVRAAVAHERERLAAGPWHPPGAPLPRATHGWDESAGRTVLQRTKETAADYRYFPEPDLPVLPAEALAPLVAGARGRLEAALAARERAAAEATGLAARHGLSADQAARLLERDVTGGRWLAAARAAASMGLDAALSGEMLARWFLGPLAGWVNARGGDWTALRAGPRRLAEAIALVLSGAVRPQVAKEHFLAGEWPGTDRDPAAFLAERGIAPGADAGGGGGDATGTAATGVAGPAAAGDPLRAVCEEVIAASPDIVARIRAGKTAAKQALVGQVMKRTRGTADPKSVNATLDELLA